MAADLAPELVKSGRHIHIYASCMQRAIATASALYRRCDELTSTHLDPHLHIRTDLFENEGIYGSARSPEGDLVKVPGVAKDHNQINALGVELGVPLNLRHLPLTGPWDSSPSVREKQAGANERARSVCEWLLSPGGVLADRETQWSACEPHAKHTVVVVTHSAFMDILLKAILNRACGGLATSELGRSGLGRISHQPFFCLHDNTASTKLSLKFGVPGSDYPVFVSLHWVNRLRVNSRL